MIPQSKIEEILERADIVDVISEYVPLKDRGKNYLGLCPFHSEKTPSFTVSREKKIFYCFGCHAGGSAVTFLMKHEGIPFPDALKTLARRYGVKIGEEKSQGEGRKEAIFGLNRAASEFFRNELLNPTGREARDYLKERGYEGEILERFFVGYAPPRWDGLTAYLKKKGLGLELAENIGLISSKDKRRYDYFRGRIMFPIMDAQGRVVAFGGREIDSSPPKYLNSPESSVFKKGETLYGFYQAKQSINKSGYVIISEGYFDLLALHNHGFTNSVATMGTALTAEHIRKLKPYAACLFTLFDSDPAGVKATLRGLDIFLEADTQSKVVFLPSGKDPDEFFKKGGFSGKEGGELLKKAIEDAPPLMEFFIGELKKKFDLKTPGGKASYLDSCMPYILKVRNIAERDYYAQKASADLGIDVKAMYSAMNMAKSGGGPPSKALAGGMKVPGGSLAEKTILKVILRHPELYTEKVGEAFSLFGDPFLKEVADYLKPLLMEKRSHACAFLDAIADEKIKGFVVETLLKDERGFIESPERMLADCATKVLSRGLPKNATLELLKRLEESGRADIASKILHGITKGS